MVLSQISGLLQCERIGAFNLDNPPEPRDKEVRDVFGGVTILIRVGE